MLEISSVTDAFERAAGSSDRSSWLPGCSVLEDESHGVKKDSLGSTAKLTVSTPGKIEASRVCRGISSNWATLSRTCMIPKTTLAYPFWSWILGKTSKHPQRATFNAGRPSWSVSMVSQTWWSSELMQRSMRQLTAYQAIWKERKASPNFQHSAPCLANWLPFAPWRRQVALRDWSSTGIVQELQLSLSADPFAPHVLRAPRH